MTGRTFLIKSVAAGILFIAPSVFAQALPPPFPPGGGGPNPPPVCSPEGQTCTFDGDCCQRVCRSRVCQAPLYCAAPAVPCAVNDDCCSLSCNPRSRKCD